MDLHKTLDFSRKIKGSKVFEKKYSVKNAQKWLKVSEGQESTLRGRAAVKLECVMKDRKRSQNTNPRAVHSSHTSHKKTPHPNLVKRWAHFAQKTAGRVAQFLHIDSKRASQVRRVLFPHPTSGKFQVRRRYVVATIAAVAVVAFILGGRFGDTQTAAPVNAKVAKSTPTKTAQQIREDAIKTARKSGVYGENVNNLVLQSVAKIDSLESHQAVETAGFNLDQQSLDALNNQINTIRNAGYSLSFVVTDLATGNTLAYRPNSPRYTASAIKGPVVLSDFAEGAIDPANTPANVAQLVEQTITMSNNDTYASLVTQFGMTPLNNWVSGVNLDGEIGPTKYMWLSAGDFAKMWVLGYDYLFGTDAMNSAPNSNYPAFKNAALNDQNKQWFSQYYTYTENSFINQALDNTVYTKAGWINNDENFYAQNDAGIVKSDTGDYVVAVLSSAYGEYDMLSSLVKQLATIHDSQMKAE